MNLDTALRAPESYSRLDENDDRVFYQTPRLLHHLDERARVTVRRIIETLIVEPQPAILDLMASFDSHLSETIQPRELVGLGLNEEELKRNDRLDRYLLQDLNKTPQLPFDDASFDVVLNTVSVDYLVRPFEVFPEISRILRPGGLFLVIFSNRAFPQKATRLWSESDALTHNYIVDQFFAAAPDFGPTTLFSSRGKPRPPEDRYAGLGLPSDPITAIYAEKKGAPVGDTPRPPIAPEPDAGPPPEVVEARKKEVGQTLCCPYCEVPLEKFEIAPNPFCEWPDEFVWVCYNNDCPYLLGGWDAMAEQGNIGLSYRLMYNPTLRKCLPTPVPSGAATKSMVISPRG